MNPFAIVGMYLYAPWIIGAMVVFAALEQMEPPSWN